MNLPKIGIILEKKSIAMDDETFQPYIHLNLRIPVECLQDMKTQYTESSIHEAIGREISELLDK